MLLTARGEGTGGHKISNQYTLHHIMNEHEQVNCVKRGKKKTEKGEKKT
jgi:hypothetical protein